MKAYSSDLRAKILAAVDDGMSKMEAARVFRVGISTIKRYARQRHQTGSLEPKRHPGRPPTIRPAQRELLWAQVAAHPAAFLDEQCALWAARTGIRVSIATMSREIRRLEWTRKKGCWVPPNETNDAA
jgi:transposase